MAISSSPAATDPDLRRVRAGEPTNAQEAGASHAPTPAAIDALYRTWKASLSTERQAWETTLEQNLGDFYFPLHQHDKITGISNAWDYVADDPRLPRVLLLGDSISRGYTLPVRAMLAGRANVHRAPENCGPTANGLAKLGVWLGREHWDIITFNFGIHDRATPVAVYEERLAEIIRQLRPTGARLIWITSTPIPANLPRYPESAAIPVLNAAGSALAQRERLDRLDLGHLIAPVASRLQVPGDVHFTAEGYDVLGRYVAGAIAAALEADLK